MALNFKDIANKKMEDIEKPKLPPQGMYTWAVTKVPAIETSKDGKWDFVIFTIRAVVANDVDADDLKAYGKLENVVTTHRFIFDKGDDQKFLQTENRLRTFLEKHLQCASAEDTIGKALNSSVSQRFMAPLGWRPDPNDPETMYIELGKTAPVE